MYWKFPFAQRRLFNILSGVIGLGLLVSLAFYLNVLFVFRPQQPSQKSPQTTNQPEIKTPLPKMDTKQISPNPSPSLPGETGASNTGVSLEKDSQLMPSHPYQLIVEPTTGAVALKWPGTGSDIIQHYQIYRKTPADTDWQPLNKVKPQGDNRGDYEFRDTTVKRGTTYVYSVQAIDFFGNKSAMTASAAVTLQ